MLTFIDAHIDICQDSNCLLSQKSVKIMLFRQFSNLKTVTKFRIEEQFSIKSLKNCNFFSNYMKKGILTTFS